MSSQPPLLSIVLASHNTKKLTELKQLITSKAPKLANWNISSASELQIDEPVEDGATFLDNARLKARSVQGTAVNGASHVDWSKTVVIADDSGLIVNLLGNAPGILSARWSGKHGDDYANNQLLLNQLDGLPDRLRSAHFVTTCVAVIGNQELVATGEMHGCITHQMRGENGFGYDSIFIPDAYKNTEYARLTSAELSAELKNAISHRRMAINRLIGGLAELLQPLQ